MLIEYCYFEKKPYFLGYILCDYDIFLLFKNKRYRFVIKLYELDYAISYILADLIILVIKNVCLLV